MAKVFIKMVPHPSAQKRKHFTIDKKGRRETKHAKAHGKNGQPIFRFTVSDRGHGMLNTGFEKKIDNPWFNKQTDLPTQWNNGTFHKKEKISMQEYFEIKLNKAPGTLSSEKRDLFGKGPLPYMQKVWKDFFETTVLDLDDPKEEMIHYLLQQSHPDKCANSWEETTPFSRLYISQVNEDEKRIAAKSERIEIAIAKLVELKSKSTQEDVRKVAMVLNLIKGDVPILKIKNTLSEHIMKKDNKQLDKAETFIELFDSLKTKKGREHFEARYLLQECVNNRIISDYKGKYIWNSKKGTNLELLGKSKKEALNTLLDIDWRNYREELVEELKSKINEDRLMAL